MTEIVYSGWVVLVFAKSYELNIKEASLMPSERTINIDHFVHYLSFLFIIVITSKQI